MEKKYCPNLLTASMEKPSYNTCKGIDCAAIQTKREYAPDPAAKTCMACSERCSTSRIVRLMGRCGLTTGDYFTLAEITDEGVPECGEWRFDTDEGKE